MSGLCQGALRTETDLYNRLLMILIALDLPTYIFVCCCIVPNCQICFFILSLVVGVTNIALGCLGLGPYYPTCSSRCGCHHIRFTLIPCLALVLGCIWLVTVAVYAMLTSLPPQDRPFMTAKLPTGPCTAGQATL
jgi:hypothetical protein